MKDCPYECDEHGFIAEKHMMTTKRGENVLRGYVLHYCPEHRTKQAQAHKPFERLELPGGHKF